LHPYHSMKSRDSGIVKGHEFVGVVEEIGSDVNAIKVGDIVIAPFAFSCGTCHICRMGLHTSCERGGFFGSGFPGIGGAQSEAVRVPFADAVLVVADVEPDSPLMPSLLTLSDVFLTGHHAAVVGEVTRGSTVAVIGDGAVGLSAVLACTRLGAERIVLLGHHTSRTNLGVEFGATDVITSRDQDAVNEVRELTSGQGAEVVLECVGLMPAYETAYKIVRPGGFISRVGVPQYEEAPVGFASLFRHNVRLGGGPAPVRAYMEEMLPEVLSGSLNPGRVFDTTMSLDQAVDGYQAMDQRRALKVLLKP
jgi:threonine dehydrogenase-like Zn-dependent dehydrogenase